MLTCVSPPRKSHAACASATSSPSHFPGARIGLNISRSKDSGGRSPRFACAWAWWQASLPAGERKSFASCLNPGKGRQGRLPPRPIWLDHRSRTTVLSGLRVIHRNFVCPRPARRVFTSRQQGFIKGSVARFHATMSLLPFTSQLIADVGISLGDEGKGRLIPEVADELRGTTAPVSVVLKVNGGANSGHTAGGIKLNLLPAGVVVRDAAHLCIGSGVVADPRTIW